MNEHLSHLVDWSKAPEGTTHVFFDTDDEPDDDPKSAGWVPDNPRYWEKFECGFLCEWRDGRWKEHPFLEFGSVDRIPRPTESPLPKAMKFRVKDEQHSRDIQEWLFSLGYSWPAERLLDNLDKPHIYVSEEGYLSWDDDEEYFNTCENTEVTLEVTKQYHWSIVDKPERETVELNGKTYYKEELEEALGKLEEAKQC
jgi:hypothetical protein